MYAHRTVVLLCLSFSAVFNISHVSAAIPKHHVDKRSHGLQDLSDSAEPIMSDALDAIEYSTVLDIRLGTIGNIGAIPNNDGSNFHHERSPAAKDRLAKAEDAKEEHSAGADNATPRTLQPGPVHRLHAVQQHASNLKHHVVTAHESTSTHDRLTDALNSHQLAALFGLAMGVIVFAAWTMLRSRITGTYLKPSVHQRHHSSHMDARMYSPRAPGTVPSWQRRTHTWHGSESQLPTIHEKV